MARMTGPSQVGRLVMSTYVQTSPPGPWKVASQAPPPLLPAAGTRPICSLGDLISRPGRDIRVAAGRPIQSPAASEPR